MRFHFEAPQFPLPSLQKEKGEAMSERLEPKHRFSPKIGCAQRACLHWENCVAAMPVRQTHPAPFHPEFILATSSTPAEDNATGGIGASQGGVTEFLCYSFEEEGKNHAESR